MKQKEVRTIYLGADHRGFELKEGLKEWLKADGYQVVDCGNENLDKDDDYVDFSLEVAKRVQGDDESLGVVLCGSGVGVAVAANKVAGIRAGQALNEEQVAHARANDQINVLSLAADHLKLAEAKKMVHSFISTSVSDKERHLRRLAKIAAYEFGAGDDCCSSGCCGGGCGGCC